MKKYLSFAAVLAAISFVSCTKEKTSEIPGLSLASTGVARISAQADFLVLGTKSLSSYTALESRDLKIDSYDIAFFNGTTLVREISVADAGITDGQIPDTTVTLPVGTYKVYVAANAYTTFEDQQLLNNGPHVLLDKFKLGSDPELLLWNLSNDAYDDDGNLVQVASGTVTVSEGNTPTAAATASLQLKRRVARIRVNSIANRLPSGMEVELEAVYLSNVSAKDLLFSDYNYMSSYKWYFLHNMDGKYYWENPASGLPEGRILGENYYDAVNDNAAAISSDIAYKGILTRLGGDSEYDTPFNLYCYRNPGTAYKSSSTDYWEVMNDNLVEWYDSPSAPGTQLVIAAGLGNRLSNPESPRTMVYYPIMLSELFPNGVQPNHTYTLDITLNSIGSSDPSEHISYGVASVAASVSGWNDGGVSTVEL